MELGSLELQIFVSLIVILGTAFVALVCDYLKGSNESLREHNIELRVRREEQEKNRPVEAVEWLQQMLGATRANPVRFGSMRTRTAPGRNRANTPPPPAKPAAAPAAAEARPAAKPEVRQPRPVAAPMPIPERTQPEVAARQEVVPPVVVPEPVAVGEVPNLTRSTSSRTRRAGTGPKPTTSLLDTLPVPAWVKREQEEIAAARAKAPEPVVEVVAEPLPFRPEPAATAEPVVASAPVEVLTIEPVVELVPAEVLPVLEPAVEPVVEPVVEVAEAAEAVEAHLPEVRIEEETVLLLEPVAEAVAEPPAFTRLESLVSEPLPEVAAETPNFTVVQDPLPEVSFAGEQEPVLSIWRTDVEAIAPAASQPPAALEPVREPEQVPTTTFWSYRGLMDREPGAKTPAPPAPAAEPGKREELARDNFILYRGLEPARTVDPEPEFVGIENPEPVAADPPPVFEEALTVVGSAIPDLDLPVGYQDRAVLQQLMTATGVLSGVVVAIGINDYLHQVEKMGATAMQDLMRNVEQMIAGLLRPGIDFGCRSSEDEFVLVFNKEAGPEAQRRLSTISERLWNFQLRSLTSFSVFFSWGAVEVQGETLADAAASASERMYQTKRNRKTVTMDQRRKKAVNL